MFPAHVGKVSGLYVYKVSRSMSTKFSAPMQGKAGKVNSGRLAVGVGFAGSDYGIASRPFQAGRGAAL